MAPVVNRMGCCILYIYEYVTLPEMLICDCYYYVIYAVNMYDYETKVQTSTMCKRYFCGQ